jgi:hypothetical protein
METHHLARTTGLHSAVGTIYLINPNLVYFLGRTVLGRVSKVVSNGTLVCKDGKLMEHVKSIGRDVMAPDYPHKEFFEIDSDLEDNITVHQSLSSEKSKSDFHIPKWMVSDGSK